MPSVANNGNSALTQKFEMLLKTQTFREMTFGYPGCNQPIDKQMHVFNSAIHFTFYFTSLDFILPLHEQ